MNKNLAVCLFCAMTLSTAYSQTVRDLPLNAPVDARTIAVAYSQVSNAVATAVRLGQLDQASLAAAIQLGQDLHLIQRSTNGWVVAVSNIVEVDQAHVPGVLFVGDTIYGSPSSEKGRVDITGCDFYYDRQIPGDGTGTNGWGNLVTDPYMDWRLGSFFQQWGATNAAMWATLMDINDLPASLASDLQAYSSATGGIAQSISQLNGIKDEINATNVVIRSVIENALSQASGGGGQSWTTSSTSSAYINCADHCVTVCDNYSDSSFTVVMPTSTGTAHSKVVFTSAYSLGENHAYVDYSCDGTYYGLGSYSGFSSYNEYNGYDEYYNCVVLDIWEAGSGVWIVEWKGLN